MPSPPSPGEPAALSPWPPSLSPSQLNSLSTLAKDYALSHGLVYRPLPTSKAHPPSTSTIHAPLSLLPTPFPRHLFDLSAQLQPIYNELYSRVTLDDDFLASVIGGSVAKVDEFQGKLFEIWEATRREAVQPLHLGLFRSDYLLHSRIESQRELGDDKASREARSKDATSLQALELKQVEFNTISSSFGPLCQRVNELHHYLAAQTSYHSVHPSLAPEAGALPVNKALDTLAGGLAAGHRAYLEQHQPPHEGAAPVILFVVQDGERNAFDQRWIEFELLQKHGVRVVRQTFDQLSTSAKLSDDDSRSLHVAVAGYTSPLEVSVVYYRAGYGPSDYESSTAWEVRLLLERSLAIKCPTAALQLAGAKKVQQVLTLPGVLETFLSSTRSQEEIGKLRASFMELYPLDDTDAGREGLRLALSNPKAYVLKPQREGGGNNVYKEAIPGALDEMERRDAARRGGEEEEEEEEAAAVKEREGFILMSLIQPPGGIGAVMLKAPAHGGDFDEADEEKGARLAEDVVSELGRYGAVLFAKGAQGGQQLETKFELSEGYLLRTKGRESDEGGVAVGFSVIDSPVLVG